MALTDKLEEEAKKPNYIEAHLFQQRAWELKRQGKEKEAQEFYVKALDQSLADKDYGQAGMIADEMGDHTLAHELYKKAGWNTLAAEALQRIHYDT